MDKSSSETPQPWWIYRALSEEERAAERAADEDASGPGVSARCRKDLDPDHAPPWRRFPKGESDESGAHFQANAFVKDRVNAALMLRRPLLVTGRPGTGKSSLARAIADELGLGKLLRWPITSRTTLKDGLYRYDAVRRLQETQRWSEVNRHAAQDESRAAVPRWLGRGPARHWRDKQMGTPPAIQDYLKLGPLGTAFGSHHKVNGKAYPRVLLIDEIDKSDIDLPNDLLNIFEEGYFEIEEMERDPAKRHKIRGEDDRRVTVNNGRVRCHAFPIVVMTSNSEREFPAPFLRRCIRLDMPDPEPNQLAEIVRRKLLNQPDERIMRVIEAFHAKVDKRERILAVDQLLQVVYLMMNDVDPFEGRLPADRLDPTKPDHIKLLISDLWRSLEEGQV